MKEEEEKEEEVTKQVLGYVCVTKATQLIRLL
jgi:hypothetical protein